MDHRLISGIEKALDWSGPHLLGTQFSLGCLPDPDLCARILTPTKMLDLIMRRSLDSPQLRFFQNGSEVHPADYLDGARTRRGQNISMANMRRIGRLIESGCTLVLDSVDTFDATMEVACRALQWWTRELVQVNTYLTTQDSSGFSLHWDDHDVLIVQLAGEKEWEVRGQSRKAPMHRDTEENRTPPDEVVWSGMLRCGDVMHIPRGYWHRATRNGQGPGFSLHATFGFVKRTGVDWLVWVADYAREDELFRRDLNRWSSPEEQKEDERSLATAAARLLASWSPSDYLAAREQERPPHRHVSTGGVFSEPAKVVCITEFPPRLIDDGDNTTVIASGKKITFTNKALPALRLLLSGQPVAIHEAVQATGIDVEQLAKVLIREEICAELTPELSSGYTGLVINVDSSSMR